MNRARSTTAVSLISLAFCGCLFSDRLPYRDDPLLVQRKPLQGSPEKAKPSLLLVAEPSPPALPTEAFVQRPPAYWPDTALAGSLPGSVRGNESIDGPARLEAWPVSRPKISGVFGHAPDYTWLQGTVECLAGGVIELRYVPENDGDVWGGRVRLEKDTRLQQIQVGDVLLVEGELQLHHDPATARPALEAPAYRVRVLWLVRRAPGSL
jgi:hypothetical protein